MTGISRWQSLSLSANAAAAAAAAAAAVAAAGAGGNTAWNLRGGAVHCDRREASADLRLFVEQMYTENDADASCKGTLCSRRSWMPGDSIKTIYHNTNGTACGQDHRTVSTG